mgnify:FL=1|jgi:hypothetical protein
MQAEAIESFFGWINERHAIYRRRARGAPAPWTIDPILEKYKFTNPFRENDRVTIWMRENFTNPNEDRPHGEIIFNCCLFRMVGTSEFADAHGWVREWDPDFTKNLILTRLSEKRRTFTGAYIITNQGLKCSKAEVVVDRFLTPIWETQNDLAEVARTTQSLQALHGAMRYYKGWGGGGFMSYEVVTDLNYTPVLHGAEDRYTWANAGPGAVRGLNRIHGRDVKKGMSQKQANTEMQQLLALKEDYLEMDQVDMRTIEHSLCEWDKYQRVRLGQGRPRSLYHPTPLTDFPKGAVE